MKSTRNAEWALLFAVLLDMIGFTMLIPDIQLRAEQMLGTFPYKGPVIGILLQSTFLVQLLVSPKWGKWADSTGRKRVFLFCQFLSAVAMLLYGLSTAVLLLFASRIVAGFGAANVSTAQAIASSLGDEKYRTKALGRISAALSAGMIVGPAVGGFAAHAGDSALVGFVGAGISALGGLVVWMFVPGDQQDLAAQKDASAPSKKKWLDFSLFVKHPEVKPFFWITAAGSFALGTLEGTFGRLIKAMLGFDAKQFGIIFSYEAVLGVLMGGLLLGWISKRLCETTLLRWGYVLQGVGLGLNPLAGWLSSFAPGLFWLFVASTFYGIGAGAIGPTLASLSSSAVAEDVRGEMFGMLQSARTAGFLMGPLIGGLMFDFWHPLPYLFAMLVCFSVALFLPVICKCHPIKSLSL